jgi:hypothetical protein
MTYFNKNLIAALLVGSLGVAHVALAGGGCGGNGGNRGNGGYNGGNGGYNGGNNNRNNQSCDAGGGGYNSNPYNPGYGQAYEPFHSSYFVQPGDSFYEVSLKEYGTSAAAPYIAQFNRMNANAALVPNQRLMLPSISAAGRLSASRAPGPDMLNGSQGPFGPSTAKFTRPAEMTVAQPAAPAVEPERPSVPTGSTLQLDGPSLGSETGVVRLRINNVAFPVEVVEWSADSTKVRLPNLDVSSATKAELEVIRADGSLAATNAIELTTPATGLARAN